MQHDTSERFTRLRHQKSLPPALVDFLEAVTTLHQEALEALHGLQPSFGLQLGADEHVAGKPLLDWTALLDAGVLSTDLASKHMDRLADAVAQLSPGHAASVGTLLQAEEQGVWSRAGAMQSYLQGDLPALDGLAELTPQVPGLARFLATAALAPQLEAAGARAMTLRDELQPRDTEGRSAPWPHGSCPACGSLPLMGRLEPKHGGRSMACSSCRVVYRVPRLGCPFCGEQEDERLGYFTALAEGEASQQQGAGVKVYTCESCSCYVKTVDGRESDGSWSPLIEDAASLALDMAAQKRGYARPTLSAWGF